MRMRRNPCGGRAESAYSVESSGPAYGLLFRMSHLERRTASAAQMMRVGGALRPGVDLFTELSVCETPH